jgi:site-specific DNA recombinase
VEQQLQKIIQEKMFLDQRIKELEAQIKSEETAVNQLNAAENMLISLKAKIDSNPPFDIRREVVRTLVKEVTVDTMPSDNGRSTAIITTQYSFTKVVVRTDRDSLRPQA